MVTPYKEELIDSYIIRTFNKDLSHEDLKWHFDEEDRIITSISKTDWLFQFDNELPIELNKEIFIPKNVYHRLIKGNSNISLKIIKL